MREPRSELGLMHEQSAVKIGMISPTVTRWQNAHGPASSLVTRRTPELCEAAES